METKIKVCLAWSPHHPRVKREKFQTLHTAVECNRPYGHEGNHAHSDETGARRWEWTERGEVIR